MAEKLILNANFIHKADGFAPQKCAVEKVIEVSGAEFKEFIENPMKNNGYLSLYRDLMGYYDNEYHGILFVNIENGDGFLVNSEGADYARYSQFIPNAADIIAFRTQKQELSANENLTELKLFCPLKFTVEPEDDGEEFLETYPEEYKDYVGAINNTILDDLAVDEESEKHGLAAYLDEENLAAKIYSITPKVEVRNGGMYGAAVIKSRGALDKAELSAVTEYISGQFSDGWGEGFELRPVTLGNDKVYISFWNSEDYYLKPESEVFPEQDFEQTMGGIT